MLTHKEFIRKHPEFSHLPEYIIGVGDRRLLLMDATYEDLKHYQKFLRRRIARRTRRQQMAEERMRFRSGAGGK